MTCRLIFSLFCLLSFGSSFGDERILNFHSDITIAADATMIVEETIRVRGEGANIRRGIYRDFPTDYKDTYGNRYVVDFEVLGVTRDGKPEPWHTSRLSNGVRVYAGSADRFLQPGEYNYTIRYRTNRQIGYFDDHDELYWNVTGNGWDFVVDEASAIVRLPVAVPGEEIAVEGYTGGFGTQGRDYNAATQDGVAHIGSTRALNRREGLTLVVSWPKGVVDEPGIAQRLGFLLHDNRGVLLALLTFLLVTGYLFLMWSRYGRDPAPGVIFPRYEPPRGYSPASARYISKMGYDSKALSAAVINLAVKGYLSISKDGDEYTLKKKTSGEKLARGESVLLKTLFMSAPVLQLDDKNHMIVGAAKSAHAKALKKDYLNIYFFKNGGLLLPSLIGIVVMLIVIIQLGAITPVVVALLAVSFALHGFFAYLLKAPTPKGRLLMDELEGFQLYPEVAEKDDMNSRLRPDMTPALFEKYLPFAVALGVEQAWAEQFTRIFAAMEAHRGVVYRPAWYNGEFNHMRLSGFADNVGSGFTSAISSAATAPGSSSGSGGGGFSGGGGGGGGGGGW
ncbi:MAG: DUF2207 domain-containing protein [Gammaproteobacteria bacterium]